MLYASDAVLCAPKKAAPDVLCLLWAFPDDRTAKAPNRALRASAARRRAAWTCRLLAWFRGFRVQGFWVGRFGVWSCRVWSSG